MSLFLRTFAPLRATTSRAVQGPVAAFSTSSVRSALSESDHGTFYPAQHSIAKHILAIHFTIPKLLYLFTLIHIPPPHPIHFKLQLIQKSNLQTTKTNQTAKQRSTSTKRTRSNKPSKAKGSGSPSWPRTRSKPRRPIRRICRWTRCRRWVRRRPSRGRVRVEASKIFSEERGRERMIERRRGGREGNELNSCTDLRLRWMGKRARGNWDVCMN